MAEIGLPVNLDTEAPRTKGAYGPGAQEQVWTRERFGSCTLVGDRWSYEVVNALREKE